MPYIYSPPARIDEYTLTSARHPQNSTPEHQFKLTQKQKSTAFYDSSKFYACRDNSAFSRAPNSCTSLQSESDYGGDLPSLFSTDSLHAGVAMETSMLKRTRAKTPVFSVGQLEASHPPPKLMVGSEFLAEQYKAILPLRIVTTIHKPNPPKRAESWRRIRKVKGDECLYLLAKEPSRTSSISDSETLVGSEPASPLSPSFAHLEAEKHTILDVAGAEKHMFREKEIMQDDDLASQFDTDVALNLCMELLTSKLANSVSRHHPLEKKGRSSSLQVLLMIEAYEKVQQQVRRRLHGPHVERGERQRLRDVDMILEHWLQVLFSVYDLTLQ